MILSFTTDVVPAADRLALFRRGATDFQVEEIGDRNAFSATWKLAEVGELNIVDAHISPVRYSRTPAMVEADGRDRVAVLYFVAGEIAGTFDGEAIRCDTGDALILDLTRPFDVTSAGPVHVRIVTLPRYLIDEVLPGVRFEGRAARGAALTLAFDQVEALFAGPDALPAADDVFYARALRDLVMAGIWPARQVAVDDVATPLLHRAIARIDQDLAATRDEATFAASLGTERDVLHGTLARFGGLALLVERRRLLAAYRRLSEPAETAAIGRIAKDCGFTSAAVFSRRFKDVFGSGPRALRLAGMGRLPGWAGAYRLTSSYAALLKP